MKQLQYMIKKQCNFNHYQIGNIQITKKKKIKMKI